MQQRITFIHTPADAIDPATINITPDTLTFESLQAVREDRITLSLDELSSDIQDVLGRSHELHVRYEKDVYAERVTPLLSRVSPGLHVYWTPKEGGDEVLLNTAFRPFDTALCQSPQKSFNRLPSQRFQHSAAYSYYLPQSTFSPTSLPQFLLAQCAPTSLSCRERLFHLRKATSLDLSYSAISHALTLTSTVPSQLWSPNITSAASDRTEVGLLSTEPAFEPEHLSMGGFLTVLGSDTKPAPVHFTFPSRHHPLPSDATFTARFRSPTGLHPTLELDISSPPPPPALSSENESCALHVHLSLPKEIFADAHQFKDELFLASKNLSALRYSTPAIDLEAPSYIVSSWGSELLFSLSPAPTPVPNIQKAEIPLHLRYLPLTHDTTAYQTVSVPLPVVFWACTGEEGGKYAVNPFDRVNLGWDGLFGPRTTFWGVRPLGGRSGGGGGDEAGYLKVSVPGLDSGVETVVRLGTAAVVLGGFLWVLWKLGSLEWLRAGGARAGGLRRSSEKDVGRETRERKKDI